MLNSKQKKYENSEIIFTPLKWLVTLHGVGCRIEFDEKSKVYLVDSQQSTFPDFISAERYVKNMLKDLFGLPKRLDIKVTTVIK